MWVFTRFGFFSVVKDAQVEGNVLVRARDQGDLEALRDRLAVMSEDPDVARLELFIRVTPPPADYRYKLSVPQDNMAVLLAETVAEIDYTNFKGIVGREQGMPRADAYHDVWDALLPLQDASAEREASPAVRSAQRLRQTTRGRRP